MKKILMVSHWYYPKSVPRAFRATALVEELKRRGYNVDLIIGDYRIKVESNKYENFKNELQIKNTKTNQKKKYSSFFGKAQKIFNYFLGERFLFSSGFFLYKKIEPDKYDVVISIGLPFYIHLITSLKIKKKKETMFIGDWSDPFYGIKDISLAFYFKKIQKNICNKFDYNIIPTEKSRDYFREYSPENQIKVIPQGFNFKKTLLCNYEKNSVPTFGYAGIFYKKIRNPKFFLEYLTSLDRDFKFIIYTNLHGEMYEDVLIEYKKKLGAKLQLEEMIEREDCIKELSKMDFLINFENGNTEQIPSKIIDYKLSQRPIMSFKHDLIPEQTIHAFLNGDYSEELEVDISKFDIDIVVDQFEALWK
ncbi:hypothetical protein EVJ32_11580 [Exiguobacterium sp. SH5S4]|uniref:glycosyltransferase n=1 Tax=Exiguobacterium sp. SH5S4 TaxID=2510961 RepID=UPI0010394204|nr:glycosyltransferase [Exiguobacterium sp. SH5S4]TCI25135.1 hypothetical protein EVJ32_11580 [Exiguobacterium sp. SH5S4]